MTTTIITQLEKLIGGPRDGALLRYSLGSEWLKAGDPGKAAASLREAVARDPEYSAAWKLLGKALLACGCETEAEAAWRAGLGAAARRGDVQSSKEMTVFLRRIARGRQAMS